MYKSEMGHHYSRKKPMLSERCRCQMDFIGWEEDKEEDSAAGNRYMFEFVRSITEGEPESANTVLVVDAL